MKKLIIFWTLILATNVFANNKFDEKSQLNALVPDGFMVVDAVYGDLNEDKNKDVVIIVKSTDKHKVLTDLNGGELEQNRRGIIVAFAVGEGYELVVDNTNCFSSANENGGVYFPPELEVSIKDGSLYIHYFHGRYGYWSYNFHFQGTDFDLISFERSENNGPIVERFMSVNFENQVMLIKESLYNNEEGSNEFKETRRSFSIDKKIKLSEVLDFDEINIEGVIEFVD